MAINSVELSKMSSGDRYALRRKCAENRDLESLFQIVKYHFTKGSNATNESNLPELFYYSGRLNRVEELNDFLSDKEFHLIWLSEPCKDLAKNLLKIGLKFPNLTEAELCYLEEKYCDPKTFELFEIIMFDCDKLSRPLKKFERNALNVVHSDYSREFLLEIYKYFSENDELDNGYSRLYIYSKSRNEIIQKKLENIGIGEFCITQPICSNELYILLKEKFGEESAEYFNKALCFDGNLDEFKNAENYLVHSEDIEETANDYFPNKSTVEDLKAEVSRFWLNKVNSIRI